MQKCAENSWSRNILVEQIESNLYSRQGKSITNFSITLPQEQSDLAKQTLKNPYIFDFLCFGENFKERDLEKALIRHLKQFMLELGKGFAYVGNQKNLIVGGDDFFLDLLFYNYHLHCFVIFELKIGGFKPEYAGKLNFYVNAVNKELKSSDDRPTIGILLCKTPNETVVRYSLQGIDQPIGVTQYQIEHSLPDELKGEIPTMEELEAEIDKEYEELKSPVDQKLDKLKGLIKDLNQPEVSEERSSENSLKVFSEVVSPMYHQIANRLDIELKPLFKKIEMSVLLDHIQYDSPSVV